MTNINLVWVARIEIHDEGTKAIAFQLEEGETPHDAAQSFADCEGGKLIEVMTVGDFMCGTAYELCSY